MTSDRKINDLKIVTTFMAFEMRQMTKYLITERNNSRGYHRKKARIKYDVLLRPFYSYGNRKINGNAKN